MHIALAVCLSVLFLAAVYGEQRCSATGLVSSVESLSVLDRWCNTPRGAFCVSFVHVRADKGAVDCQQCIASPCPATSYAQHSTPAQGRFGQPYVWLPLHAWHTLLKHEANASQLRGIGHFSGNLCTQLKRTPLACLEPWHRSHSKPRVQGGGLETIQAGRDLNHSLSSAPGRTAPMEYTKISQFKHLVEVYAGSISTVYKGICVATGLHVVVKVYHKSKMTAKQEHKLVREVDIQNRVKDCPFVCQLLATFSDTDKVRVRHTVFCLLRSAVFAHSGNRIESTLAQPFGAALGASVPRNAPNQLGKVVPVTYPHVVHAPALCASVRMHFLPAGPLVLVHVQAAGKNVIESTMFQRDSAHALVMGTGCDEPSGLPFVSNGCPDGGVSVNRRETLLPRILPSAHLL